jgi:1,4-alpha-glucan branching enzyme
MYWHMDKKSESAIIDRAVALHKIIRLITCMCAGEGYLNFMGNEFGHPEWIDFPRPENGFCYHYARRFWRLADDENLRYAALQDFDKAMIALAKKGNLLKYPSRLLHTDEKKKIIAFEKGKYLFLFNFHVSQNCDFSNIAAKHPKGYREVLNTSKSAAKSDLSAIGPRTAAVFLKNQK